MTNRLAPSVRHVRGLDGKYYLIREAAEMVGINHRTLRNLMSKDPDQFGPSFYTFLGKIKIYLYTDADIERLRKYVANQQVVYSRDDPGPTIHTSGRTAKWTPAQRKIRQRMFSQAHYYKQQARKHVKEGNQEKAEKAMNKMREIKEKLRTQDMDKTYSE